MHAASNACYRVQNIFVDNRLVVTNRMPIGLNRGYGGPQFYFALERAMDTGARQLGIDPPEVAHPEGVIVFDEDERAALLA